MQVELHLQTASLVLMALRRSEDREAFTADELLRQQSSLDDPYPKVGLAPEAKSEWLCSNFRYMTAVPALS